MKHSNGSIAKCRSHLQPGPWHSWTCVVYEERLGVTGACWQGVCGMLVCLCVRACVYVCVCLIGCIELRECKRVGRWREGRKESILVFTGAVQSPVGSKRERLHSRARAASADRRAFNTQGDIKYGRRSSLSGRTFQRGKQGCWLLILVYLFLVVFGNEASLQC